MNFPRETARTITQTTTMNWMCTCKKSSDLQRTYYQYKE